MFGLMHLRYLYSALAKEMYKGLPQSCCFLERMFDLRRFNLLSEESEGFAKLLDALLRFDKISMDPAHVKSLVRPGTQIFPRTLVHDLASLHSSLFTTDAICPSSLDLIFG